MAQEQLDVNIEGGTVRGTAEGDLVSFKGVPFAQPPVGALRWRAPQPVKPWGGVRDASKFGPDAMQLPTPGAQNWPVSEDCLYLNVWRPADQTGGPLPVLVWIYGGGLVRGRGSRYVLDRFTRQGGMVVVSFNYRENRLGFSRTRRWPPRRRMIRAATTPSWTRSRRCSGCSATSRRSAATRAP